jgi:heat shock protein HtpX
MAPEPNAFTVGRSRRHATIVVTEALCRRPDQRELEAALAHELAHIQHRDVAVMTIASSFALALAWLVRMIGPDLPPAQAPPEPPLRLTRAAARQA